MSKKTEAARRRRRYIGYPLEAAFLYLIYGIFMVLPLDAASAFGGWIGRTIGPRLRTSRKARRNLDRAMPELSEARRDEILIGMWDNLGRVMAEYPHLNEIWKRTEVVGAEIVQEIAASKKPALFYSAHTGNWEVALLGASRFGLPVTAVYRRPNNPAVSWLIDRARSVIGSRLVPKGRDGAREVVATLRENGDRLHADRPEDERWHPGAVLRPGSHDGAGDRPACLPLQMRGHPRLRRASGRRPFPPDGLAARRVAATR